MKKKIFGGLLVLAIAAVAAFNLNLNSEDSEFSLLSLANVEALASMEIELPEVVIECGRYEGKCWAVDYTTTFGRVECYFSGRQRDHCVFFD